MFSFIDNFSKLKVLVLGDLMLDEWIIGQVERISPEAPVPVINVEKKKYSPGGASNVALNLKEVGAKVFVAGVVGEDIYAKTLMQLLHKNDIDINAIVISQDRNTTLKSRVIARNQQVVRIDIEKTTNFSKEVYLELIERIDEIIKENNIDAILVSDYNKGILSSFLSMYFKKLRFMDNNIKFLGGPKPANIKFFKNFDFISLNKKEAYEVVGFPLKKLEDVHDAAVKILLKTGVKGCIITLGKDGLYLALDSGNNFHIPSLATEVYDVSGAGDTLLSVFALSYLSNSDIKDAALLANIAASLVIKKLGTATVNIKELKGYISEYGESIYRLFKRN